MQANTVNLEIAEPISWLLSKPKRVKIVVGGRSSTKSTAVAGLMLMFADGGARVCCAREFWTSIDESVHENMKQEIVRLNLEEKFIPMAQEIRGVNGGSIFYRGLARHVTNIKSIAGVNYLWIEEGESISENSLKVVTPSIRRSAKDNVVSIEEGYTPPEIWITMNRGSSKDAVAKKYLKRAEPELARTGRYEDDLVMIVQINYNDNPWHPEEMEKERLDDLANKPRAEYDHIWNGTYSDSVDNAIISAEMFDACIDAHIKLGFEKVGQERVSYDPADSGDAKAIAHSHGSVIINAKQKTDGAIDTATDWATDYAIEHRPDAFTWDGDGMGAGLKRQIATALEGKKIEMEVFRGSEGADQPDKIYEKLEADHGTVKKAKTNKETFVNKRAQYYWMLRDRMLRTYRAVEAGTRVFNPDDLISFSSEIEELQALRAEVCRIPRKYNGSGRIQLMTKQEMLKMDIDSPNLADAVMMLMRPVNVAPKKRQEINFTGWK